ncbi:hypothetical protein ABIF50_008237 [Bradyrhizobium diazoefficiens]
MKILKGLNATLTIVVHVLQDEQAGEKPRRRARLPRTGLAHRTKAVTQKLPVDQRRQPH